MKRTTPLFLTALCLGAAPLAAQAKRALTPADFDQWRSVSSPALSRTGEWVAYSLVPQVGDGEVVVRRAAGGAEFRHSRGYVGRPQTRAGATGPGSGYQPGRAQFSADARVLVFAVEQPKSEWDRARRERRGPADMPRPGLAIMSLPGGTVTSVARVRSFRMPEDGGRWLAYLMEPDSAAPRADSATAAPAAAATPGGTPRPVSTDTARGGARKKEYGSTLVIRDLHAGTETRIDDVTAYSFDRGGRWLGYTVSSRRAGADGAYVRALADGRAHPLLTGAGSYRAIVFSDDGRQAAFASDHDDTNRDRPKSSLYHVALGGQPRVRRLVPPVAVGAGRMVAERAPVRFTRDGGALVFGVLPVTPDSIPADSLADKAVFDLWNYRDARLQPQQRAEAGRDRDSAWTAVAHPATGRVTVVGSDTLRGVQLSEDGRIALASDELRYALPAMWGEGGADAYVIDTRTGARRMVADSLPFDPQLSPDGRFVIYFDRDRRWHAYEVATGRTTDLTGRLTARFDQETWDTPSQPAPWGVAGWTTGDRSVLVYDRYDVWEMDPTGRRPARMVTDSAGRRGQMVFRWTDLDPEERSIDPRQPLLFRVFDERTKASGYFRDRLDGAAPPVRLVMEDRQLGNPLRARDADVYLWTRQTVTEFPDLWVSGASFADARRMSEANPQQSRYRWASAELVSWRSEDGHELQGLLYKPEGFDASRKYPMVVYFYESLSDNLHQYRMDVPRNVIHPTLYASNDYLVFMPDIHYTSGYPGASALRSIVPGVRSLVARGFVDSAAVGTQGQSWGGYQTAYMITRTNVFRAAMAGAPVANMTSAYGGIRWQSGLARAFQYEHGQSRIGATPWQNLNLYIENSPLFAADRINTPLMIMHNDGDGAVPWYQGIEMFVALRRLGKEVYLINYNGDEHNPTKRANQVDVAIRMMQFFDHHLRGRPAPEWMVSGVPFLNKGRDQVLPPAEVPPTTAPVPATTTAAAQP
ncbi:MAG TPA: prolyl oligopeptidase family serine peptidase [Longimicrobium sp.]|nr:prolyl oligopeptidase family serine peptidase [Longimicrobium sp.]